VVQTPFDSNNRVDLESLEHLVEAAIRAGVNGLLAPVVASEAAWLTAAERREVVRRIANVAANRTPLILGASSASAEACIAAADLIEETGAIAYLVGVPPNLYDRPGKILAFFQSVAAGNPYPLIVQDLQFHGPGMSLDLIRGLRDCVPNLAGLKIETVPAGPKYTAVREALGTDFFIAGGWAVTQMIEALDRGVDAMMPESSMVPVYAAIGKAHASGDRARAQSIFRQLLPVLAFTNQELATSIAFFKRLLVRKGVFAGEATRMPGFVWDRYNSRIAEELIESYLELERSVTEPP